MKICINSEFGKLEGVVIHQPGSEVENMTPENAERALYSDILNLSIASKEFAALEGVLKKVTQVFYVKNLLTDILQDESVKLKLMKDICNNEGNVCNPNKLAENHAENLATEGVVLEKNNLTNYLSNERFLLRPLHNLFFTRDSALGMNDHMIIGKMANPVREREALIMEAIFNHHPSLIMEAIFNHHPSFETKTLNPANPKNGISFNPKSTVEGGDFQVARENVFVIGTGVRTSTQGIDFIIENIKQLKTGLQHIIVQELPSTPESFIHLDMVFTFLNTDSCMIYEPLITKMSRLRTIHIQIEDSGTRTVAQRRQLLCVCTRQSYWLRAQQPHHRPVGQKWF